LRGKAALRKKHPKGVAEATRNPPQRTQSGRLGKSRGGGKFRKKNQKKKKVARKKSPKGLEKIRFARQKKEKDEAKKKNLKKDFQKI